MGAPAQRTNRETRYADIIPFPGAAESQEMIVRGRPVVYGQRTMLFKIGGVEYYEVIERGALDEADIRDVVFRYNHSSDMFVMARTRGGSLKLIRNDEGLDIEAKLFNIQQARDLYELIKEGAVDKMSFAFTIREESFDKETRTWHVRKIDKLFDVAAVDQPAYEATSISARYADQIQALERARTETLEREQAAALERERQRSRLILLAKHF
jgi:HK97 family phage prohead protease